MTALTLLVSYRLTQIYTNFFRIETQLSLLKGAGVKAKTTDAVFFQQIFIWKALFLKQKIRRGKSSLFLKALFKTYSKLWILVAVAVWVIKIMLDANKSCSAMHATKHAVVLVQMNVFFHLKMDRPEILSVGFSNPKNLILLQKFLYMVWIKSYPHVNTNA